MGTLLFLFASMFFVPCEPAENIPRGNPTGCSMSVEGACCTWHFAEDRFCVPGDDCALSGRAIDSFDTLRSANRWCYRFWCGWLLEKEVYYSYREGLDKRSQALQQIHKVIKKYKFKAAKRLARKELQRLLKTEHCEKGTLCDDYLEFVIHATIPELKRVAREWRERMIY